jgi:integrase
MLNGDLRLNCNLGLQESSFTSKVHPNQNFKTFCMIDLQQTEATAKEHRAKIRRFLKWLDSRELSKNVIREYLILFTSKSAYTYANQLKSLKVYCRDYLRKPELVDSFKFPQIPFQPKTIPTTKQLRTFYAALETVKDKALFLVYVTSGLRRQEVLHLFTEQLDFKTGMIQPKQHNGRTKHTWLTFFNTECSVVLKQYLANRKDKNPKLFPTSRIIEEKLWHYAFAKTGIRITPQMLRECFCEEMGNKDVPDRYIDAFCGRLPKSVLAKHYSDYSPKKMLRIYRKANLKLFFNSLNF